MKNILPLCISLILVAWLLSGRITANEKRIAKLESQIAVLLEVQGEKESKNDKPKTRWCVAAEASA